MKRKFKKLILAIIGLVFILTAAEIIRLKIEIPPRNASTPASDVSPAAKDDLIRVDSPLPSAAIRSPLKITGQARGVWYFEAQFPVKLYDGNGKLIGSAPAKAQADWMTNDYVPFLAELDFNTPQTATGTLVFEKDNPSGLPQNAEELKIPVVFGAPGSPAGLMPIKLYYYSPALDEGPSGILCSKKGLVAVNRSIPKTSTPLADSIELLLRGGLSGAERTAGITTEFPLSGVTLQNASIKDGVATLTFADPEHKTSGGSCRVAILWAQIEATAEQFPTVESVKFAPADLFQP